MISQKFLVVAMTVLLVLTATANSASVQKRSVASNYGYENDRIDQSKHSRELEMKHDLKRLLEILLLDELDKSDGERRRYIPPPRPGRGFD